MGKDVLLCANCSLSSSPSSRDLPPSRDCGSCTKPFTPRQFKGPSSSSSSLRTTAICRSCADTWKLCQLCMDDLGAALKTSSSSLSAQNPPPKEDLKVKAKVTSSIPPRPSPYSRANVKGHSKPMIPAEDLAPPEDASITTIKVLGIGSSLAKAELTRHFIRYGEVTQVTLRNGCGYLRYKQRRAAEDAVWRSREGVALSGQMLSVTWDRESNKPSVVIPPVPEPPSLEEGGASSSAPSSSFSKSLGRGTYDPQLRQMSYFMDTNQLVVEPQPGGEGKKGNKRK